MVNLGLGECGCSEPFPSVDVWPAPGVAPRITLGLTDQCKEEGPRIGVCWVCEAEEVPVIWLGPVKLPAHTAPFMGCQPCVVRIHRRAVSHQLGPR